MTFLLKSLLCSFFILLCDFCLADEGRFSVMGVDDDAQVREFFDKVHKAFASDDANALSKLVVYPITVNVYGKKLASKTAMTSLATLV